MRPLATGTTRRYSGSSAEGVRQREDSPFLISLFAMPEALVGSPRRKNDASLPQIPIEAAPRSKSGTVNESNKRDLKAQEYVKVCPESGLPLNIHN